MDRKKFLSHISEEFNVELETIIERTLDMGKYVATQVYDSLRVLREGDVEKAKNVIARDAEVNALDISISEACTEILAIRQPTASDLRLVVTVNSIIGNLERIGDEAKKIAWLVINNDEGCRRVEHPVTPVVMDLGENILVSLHDVLSAFEHMELEKAIAVIRADRDINDKYEALIRQLVLTMMENSRLIPCSLNMIWTARSLERIGDHIKNIGEAIIYLVKGKDIRHKPIEELDNTVFG